VCSRPSPSGRIVAEFYEFIVALPLTKTGSTRCATHELLKQIFVIQFIQGFLQTLVIQIAPRLRNAARARLRAGSASTGAAPERQAVQYSCDPLSPPIDAFRHCLSLPQSVIRKGRQRGALMRISFRAVALAASAAMLSGNGEPRHIGGRAGGARAQGSRPACRRGMEQAHARLSGTGATVADARRCAQRRIRLSRSEVKCLGCNTHQTVVLDIVRRPKTTPVHELERYMRCRQCSEVRGYPYKRNHLVALRPTKISANDPPSTWWPGER
jgi:hypothetical protein